MLVYDIEADGLLDTVTKIHCMVFTDEDKTIRLYDLLDIGINSVNTDLQLNRENILKIFNNSNGNIICHNQLGYDIFLLRKFFNIDLLEIVGMSRIRDTYVMSTLEDPDRLSPISTIKGGHSLEAWGYKVGIHKPEIPSWDIFNNEILLRCEEDVKINYKTYLELCKKLKLEP